MLSSCSNIFHHVAKSRLNRIRSRTFYDRHTKSQTIFAPATTILPNKGSPLSIIRVSGVKTEKTLCDITRLNIIRQTNNVPVSGKQSVIRPRQAKLANLIDPFTHELLDIGLVLWFPKPHSYTGEDVCEFHVHGSQAIVNHLLSALGRLPDLRPAEPGEFTRRAVNNGRMSVIQAESLSELIASKTDDQRRLALKGLTGSTRQRYDVWINNLLRILAHLEASIDFGEDELIGETRVVNECILEINSLSEDISRFIKMGSQCREFIQTGARVAILGKPNTGKSTLMNILCRKEKSIVSNFSGTTRDVVEHSFELGGHTITLSDTAGLKDLSSLSSTPSGEIESVIEMHNVIEREGILRALEAAKNSHLLLYLFDASAISDENTIIEEISKVLCNLGSTNQTRSVHIVVNKIDKTRTLSFDVQELESSLRKRLIKLDDDLKNINITYVSCITRENLCQLVESISTSLDRLQSSLQDLPGDVIELDYVNERHLSLLGSALRHLTMASRLDLSTIDEMAQHVRESVDYLSRIVCSVTNEQVLDIIFKDFCIGK